MTPTELYDIVVSKNNESLLEFITKSNSSIRLTFLKSALSAENTKVFIAIARALAAKQLPDEIIRTIELQSLFTHLAFYFKNSNQRAFVDFCATHIQESVFKKRLSAWLHFKRYTTNAEHISELEIYLAKLSAARFDGDEDYTYEVISDLYAYVNKTVQNLPLTTRTSLLHELESSVLADKYPIIQQLQSEGLHLMPDLEVVRYTGKEYIPSIIAESIFNTNFVNYVKKMNLFGYDIIAATEQIIKRGQTDFDAPFSSLMPSDVVKVYCYCNMRMHYYSSLCLYERSRIVQQFYNSAGRIKLIDIGCGPATCGLAFAEHVLDITDNKASFDYFGIDTSETMRKQGKEIMKNEIFLDSNHLDFFNNIDQVDIKILDGASCIIINACYVFASVSLEIAEISNFIDDVQKTFPYVPKYFLFQNPISNTLNRKYHDFKKLIKKHEVIFSANEEIKYYTQRKYTAKSKEKGVYYEILKL